MTFTFGFEFAPKTDLIRVQIKTLNSKSHSQNLLEELSDGAVLDLVAGDQLRMTGGHEVVAVQEQAPQKVHPECERY